MDGSTPEGVTPQETQAHHNTPEQQDRTFAQQGRDTESVKTLNTAGSIMDSDQAHHNPAEQQDRLAAQAGKANIGPESTQFVKDQQEAAAITKQIRNEGAQKVAEARSNVTHSTTYVGLGTESSTLDQAKTARLDAQGKTPETSGGNFFTNLIKKVIG